MAIFDEVGASIRQLAEGAGSSVVGIGQRWGVGSGVVLGEGRVLTNAHNVRGDRVTVTFADGRTAEGNVAGRDIDGDLIVAAAGQPIRTPDDLFDALRAASGGTIELSIVRGTDERVIQVAFAGNGQPGQEA